MPLGSPIDAVGVTGILVHCGVSARVFRRASASAREVIETNGSCA
jgi:hypothetical protein